MKALYVPAIAVPVLVSAVIPLSAHHSWPVSNDRLVTVKGKVIEFMWANPHPMITLEVRSPSIPGDGLSVRQDMRRSR